MPPSILLTRPQDSSIRFAAQLRDALGAEPRVVISPVLEIVPTGLSLDLASYKALILTSANGVPAGRKGMRCYTVGDATADAARQAGMLPVSAGRDAKALIRRILADGETGPLLHLRGAHTRGDVAKTLNAAGCSTDEAVVYSQDECSLTTSAIELLSADKPVIVPLFSPRSARIFASQAQGRGRIWAVALSPAVAEAVKDAGFELINVAAAPDAGSMLDEIKRLMDAAR